MRMNRREKLPNSAVHRTGARVARFARVTATLGISRIQVSDQRYEIYLAGALFAYALPFVHNLRCIEIPFSAAYDLALKYLSAPALVLVVFGGRRLRRILRRQGYRLPTQVFVSVVLLGWIVGLGQAYVVLANALLPPQHPVTYVGTIVEKFQAGRFGDTHVVRVRVTSPDFAVIAFRVPAGEYARLMVADAFSRKMTLGPLGLPYVDHCGWLACVSQPNQRLERSGIDADADISPSSAGRSAAIR